MKSKKPRVLVIGTGGVIGAKLINNEWKYGEMPEEELLNITPGIKNEFDVKTTNLFRMNSADMGPKHWLTLANTIYYQMEDFDGVVVTMGTDTLNYASAAISFIIQNQKIPIVFTGSEVDPTQINTDARSNLRQAISVAGLGNIAETLVVFNTRIIRGTRAKRVNTSEFDAFQSFGQPEIGKIQQYIEAAQDYRKRNHKLKAKIFNKLETNVALIKAYPGMEGTSIKSLVDKGIKGIVIEGYGLGTMPMLENNIIESIKYAEDLGTEIVVTSGSSMGAFWKKNYAAEIFNRDKGTCIIPAFDMLTETAYVKLMWVLGQTQKHSEVAKMMQKNYCMEITELKSK